MNAAKCNSWSPANCWHLLLLDSKIMNVAVKMPQKLAMHRTGIIHTWTRHVARLRGSCVSCPIISHNCACVQLEFFLVLVLNKRGKLSLCLTVGLDVALGPSLWHRSPQKNRKKLFLTHYREPGSIALARLPAVFMPGNAPVGGKGILLLNIWDV